MTVEKPGEITLPSVSRVSNLGPAIIGVGLNTLFF